MRNKKIAKSSIHHAKAAAADVSNIVSSFVNKKNAEIPEIPKATTATARSGVAGIQAL